MRCLHNEREEELSWKFPFEIYYGRKVNELMHDGKCFPSNIEILYQRQYHD